MPCTLTAPCGGVVHLDLTLQHVTLLRCLNGHTHRVHHPQEAPPAPPGAREYDPVKRCEMCQEPLEAGRHGRALYHVGCSVKRANERERLRRDPKTIARHNAARARNIAAGRKAKGAPKPGACHFCGWARSGKCIRHGGTTLEVRRNEALRRRRSAR